MSISPRTSISTASKDDRSDAERSQLALARKLNPSGTGTTAPKLSSTVIGGLAAISLLSSLSVGFRHLIHVPRQYVDDYIISLPDTSFAWAFVLALIAGALGARKRIAWWITVAYIVVFGATNALYLIPAFGAQYQVGETERVNVIIGLCVQAIALIYLFATRPMFYTRVRRGAALRSLAILAAGLAAATLVGWALVAIVPHDLTVDQQLPYAFNRVVAFAALDRRNFDGHHTYGAINGVLGLLGALALITAAAALFRSQKLTHFLSMTDERVIRALIATYNADDSLAYFATRRDKAAVFAPNGLAAITYRVELGVCLASGDPVGDPNHWPAAVAEFVSMCETYGWRAGVMGTSARGAAAYANAGLVTLAIGDEAILHTRKYSLSGPTMRPVRQAVTRCRRAGISVRIRYHRDLSAGEMAEVVRLADDWRDTDEERGFSMALSRLGDPADGDCILVEAIRDNGANPPTLVGLLSFVPWGHRGVSLDLMRRDPTAINGVIETMVSEFALQASGFAVNEISLNFAAFREVLEVGDAIGAGPVMRLAHRALMFGSRFFQMESLYRANAKYQPQWVPRYLCCEDTAMIPRAGISAIFAEGLVVLPRLGRGKSRRHGTAEALPATLDADSLVAQLKSTRTSPRPRPRRPQQVRARLAKLAEIESAGTDAYPPANPPTHTVAAALDEQSGKSATIAGRVLRLRDFGSVVFAEIEDFTGRIQVIVETPNLHGRFHDVAHTVDLGDLVRFHGIIGSSRSGELSLIADEFEMLAKCLHPLPDKRHGLTDPEARVRQRHVDLITNPETRSLLVTRGAVIRSLRNVLDSQGFLEVETPILQRVHGGANAEPFRTHINAYNLELYLRIAPELYLKRLCVGGFGKVFELGRNFRNEGVDFSHNPEFTSLEAYQAHGDYMTMLHLTRTLIQAATTAAHGSEIVLRPNGKDKYTSVDISGDWPVKSVYTAVSEAIGAEITPDTDEQILRAHCTRHRIPVRDSANHGQLVTELYEHLVEETTTGPTFYIDFPTSVSPLTRAHRTIPGVAERWDLVAWGVELATAYTELTNPVEQRRRLTAQSILAAGGDPEAMELDEDFLTALEYGMMPTGGLGIGVDRLVMLITGRSIRETLAFPLAKPR